MPRNNTGFDIKDREFVEAVNQLGRISRRTWPEVTNKASGNVAKAAQKRTEKADRAEIEALMGKVATKVRVDRKTGKLKKGKSVFEPGSFVYALINSERRKKGLRPLVGKEMETEVKKFRANRLRSIGFLKSGWIPAIKKFRNAAKLGGSFGGAKVRGRPKGRATLARPGHKVETFFANSAEGILKQGVGALKQAFRDEARAIRENVAKRVSKMNRKHGARR